MATIAEVALEFDELAARIDKIWPTVFAADKTFLEHQGWPHLALAPLDASALAREIADRLRAIPPQDWTEDSADYWESMARQAKLIVFANYSSDPDQVAKSTFQFLLVCAVNLPTLPAMVDWQRISKENYVPKELAKRIRLLEARLAALEPRSETIESKINDIEAAHEAADRLPTDMEELRASSKELRGLLSSSIKDAGEIEGNNKEVKRLRAEIERLAAESDTLVVKCNENYRITTSAGLAGAFDQRSKSLTTTGWVWVAILAVSLGTAVIIGSSRLEGFKALLLPNTPTSLIVLNLLIAVIGVGGPVWLAWLATRNLSQNFKLAEDYAYKSSISKAYEGYRKEAVSLDVEMAKRLFGSALARLDEPPIRFLAQKDHNSPMEAILDNQTVKAAVNAIPAVVTERLGKSKAGTTKSDEA